MRNKVLVIGGSGLVGNAIAAALQEDYQVIPTAGHHKAENGCCLSAEDPERLLEILEQENPDIVISSIRGDFQAQILFHTELAHRDHSRSGELHHTYSGIMVNVTYAKQIGIYAKYVLDHNLHGIFHIGTLDTVEYFAFEKMICQALDIQSPKFEVKETEPAVFQAVIPARKDIPDDLQMTVDQVLAALRQQIQY